jgi:hypothetical protein
MNLACPIDNKDDSIQKVSAVVSSGQSTGTFSGPTGGIVSVDGKSGGVSGYTTLRGGSTSQLATLLAPPQEPAKPHGFGRWWFILWIVPYVAGGVAGATSNSALLAFIVGFLILILLLWAQKVFKDNSTVNYANEKPQWDKAILKWNRLYYCHKHDIVFDPDNGKTCTPPSLKEFLYQSKGG